MKSTHLAKRTTENQVQADTMKTLSAQPGVLIWRNNVGVAEYNNGSRVAYGLCPGSSDLIGLRSVTVTPEMVGDNLAVFMAVECKRPDGRLKETQERFLNAVRDHGGIAVVVDGSMLQGIPNGLAKDILG